MKRRDYWVNQIQAIWERRSIAWLSGVRRVGKTVLGKQIPDADYINCDLGSNRRRLEDPEFLLSRQDPNRPLILDEIHRLDDPSSVLKIAADEYPSVRVLATGSSTLQATRKFKDSLTGRKFSLHLSPILWRESAKDFGVMDFDRRLLHGGFPEMLLADEPDPSFFEEWLDSFFARDIQELFSVRNRVGFLKLLRLVCLRSGGQLDISDLSKESGLSRPSVMAHLDAMEIAHAVTRIPPFHGGGHREIIRQPRVFAFDSGLIAHVRGWESIRETDRGQLWEHLVLDELRALHPQHAIHYWRDKSKREIDFIVKGKNEAVDAIEAKINPDAFDAGALRVFREAYPKGENFLVCPYIDTPYSIRKSGHTIRVVNTKHF